MMDKKAVSRMTVALIFIVIVIAGLTIYFVWQPGLGPTTTTTTTTALTTTTTRTTTTTTTQPGATTTTQLGTTTTTTTAPTSPTPTGTPSSQFTVFEVGRYVEYSGTLYEDGAQASSYTQIMSVSGEDDTHGAPAWILNTTMITPGEGFTMKMETLVWYAKADMQPLYYKTTTWVDGTQIGSPQEGSLLVTPSPGTSPPPDIVTPYEEWSTVETITITVPAGTFIDATKVTTTTATGESTAWLHHDVPIWGMVQLEARQDGELQLRLRLTAYG